MTTAAKQFLSVLRLLWLRLITVSVLGMMFAAAVQDTPSRIGGWFHYLTTWEVLFELAVRVASMALTGAVLGTLITLALAPFLFLAASPNRFAETVIRVAVAVAAFEALAVLMRALADSVGISLGIALAGYCLAFAVALSIPRSREQLLSSLDHLLSERATRRFAIAIAMVTMVVAAGEWVMGMAGTAVASAAATVQPSGPNILLITFDALSAEDMSLYGYRLPTTPHIDEFARKSSVFTSFFSASTFTPPSVATMLTGIYPSEHGVYHLKGHLNRAQSVKTLPHLLRAGQYSIGASIANPWAYFLAEQIGREYDFLPSPAYHRSALMNIWNAFGILHQQQPFGSRAEEFGDLEASLFLVPRVLGTYRPRLFGQTNSWFPPSAAFAQAEEVLARMPNHFFLWVHLMAPHAPYLPGPPFLGRFLPTDQMRTAQEQEGFTSWPRYDPRDQGRVDLARVRYDEFLAQADDALGAFLDRIGNSGRLWNTAVIISADHGESFQGDVYGHGTPCQTRPEIHIPLIIRMPGQEQGHRIRLTADQTALAPSILGIAGLPRPDWMRGASLLPWLNRDDEGDGEGMAFAQYLAGSRIGEPLRSGTVGVIAGHRQCVLDLETGKTKLRSLPQAQMCDLDRSADDPELAQKLRETIYSRFPDLPREPQ